MHTEKIVPPRALWVPFELGRPLGVPNDPAFQIRVLKAALSLTQRDSGPVLEDYPEDVPDKEESSEEESFGLACPIDLPSLPDPDAPNTAMGRALLLEIDTLAPWYDVALRTRGRSTVGVSGLEISEAALYLAHFLEDQDVASPRDDMTPGQVLKLACEDLKAYYGESITAQPGHSTSRQVEDWLFRETSLGAAFWALRDICMTSEDEYLQFFGHHLIVPDRQINPP
jgi:hypothetical protein